MSPGDMIAALALAAGIIGTLFGLIFKLAINGSVQRGRTTHDLLVSHMASTDATLAYLRDKADEHTTGIGHLQVTTAQLDHRVKNIEGARWRRREDPDDG